MAFMLVLVQVQGRSYAASLCLHCGWPVCCAETAHSGADGTALYAQRSAESERSFSHSLDADASGHISRPAATYVARCVAESCLIHHMCMLCISN